MTRSLGKSIVVTLGMAAALALAPPAQAVPLVPGGSVSPVPVLTGMDPGELLATLSSPFDTPLHTTGTLLSAVYRQVNGQLDFYYQVFVADVPSGSSGVSQLQFRNFAGFTTDVWTRTDDPDSVDVAGAPGSDTDAGWTASNRTPLVASRSSFPGSQVNFEFFTSTGGGTRVEEGEYSSVMVIRTDAALYTKLISGASIVNGGTDNVNVLSPTVVPEPGSMLLLGSGLLGVAAALKRRRRQQQA